MAFHARDSVDAVYNCEAFEIALVRAADLRLDYKQLLLAVVPVLEMR